LWLWGDLFILAYDLESCINYNLTKEIKLTIRDPIKVVGNTIELWGNPVGIYTGPEHRKDELENATGWTDEDIENIKSESLSEGYADGESSGKIEAMSAVEDAFDGFLDGVEDLTDDNKKSVIDIVKTIIDDLKWELT